MPLNAWQDMVRPVVFRERLYVIWVEREETARAEIGGQVSMYERFTLKLAFRRHDGSWSAPWSHDVSTQIESILQSETGHGPALSATGFDGEDSLLVFMYQTAESYAEFGGRHNSVTGLGVYADGTFLPLSKSDLSRFSEIKHTFDVISTNTMARTKKANYRFAIAYEIPSTLALFDNSSSLIRTSKAQLEGITIQSSMNSVIINVEKSIVGINPSLQGIVGRSIMEGIAISGTSDNHVIFVDQYPTNSGWSRPGSYLAYNIKDGVAGGGGGRLSLTHPVSGDVVFLDAFGTPIARTPFRQSAGTSNLRFNISESTFRMIRKSRVDTGTPFNNSNLMTYNTPVNTDVLFNPAYVRIAISGNHFEPSSLIEENNETIFIDVKADISNLFENSSNISVEVLTTNLDGSLSATGGLQVNRVDFNPEKILQLHSTDTGAQYMQLGVHRIRLNTLLGP